MKEARPEQIFEDDRTKESPAAIRKKKIREAMVKEERKRRMMLQERKMMVGEERKRKVMRSWREKEKKQSA